MPKEFVLSEHNKVVGDGAILSPYGSNWEKILLLDQKKPLKRRYSLVHLNLENILYYYSLNTSDIYIR